MRSSCSLCWAFEGGDGQFFLPKISVLSCYYEQSGKLFAVVKEQTLLGLDGWMPLLDGVWCKLIGLRSILLLSVAVLFRIIPQAMG